MTEKRQRVFQRFMLCALIAFFFAKPILVRPCFAAEPAKQEMVDIALVLAIDISESIDDTDAKVQRDGYLAALRSKEFIDAVRAGPAGRIALTYMEWSNPGDEKQIVPWRVISDAASAESFAAELELNPLRSFGSTSIGGAIDFAVQLLKQGNYSTPRKIIDISGERCADCDTMTGRPLDAARADAVKAGVTINGLQIIFAHHGLKAPKKNIADFYQQHVIAGPKSFAMTARKPEDFTQALINKLSLEIAGIIVPRG